MNSERKEAHYLDFELKIDPGKGREYPVSVINSPAGEARETMHFPFDELALENRLQSLQIALLRSGGKHRRVLSQEEQKVLDFGRDLFETLLWGEVGNRFAVSQERAAGQGKGLRLKLRIQSPELAALPWEFMFDKGQGEYLCLSRNTPVVRYIELPQSIQPLKVKLPLRILGMVADPSDLPHLDVEREEGLVCLTDEKGKKHLLSASDLGILLADHNSLRLVLLNACEGARGGNLDIFSSSASILVRRGILAVLAMQYEITDRAAVEFARTFYETLAEGQPIDASAAEARKAVRIAVNNTLEWGTPVLYMRSPDGKLFSLDRESEVKKEPPKTPVMLEADKEKFPLLAATEAGKPPIKDSDKLIPNEPHPEKKIIPSVEKPIPAKPEKPPQEHVP